MNIAQKRATCDSPVGERNRKEPICLSPCLYRARNLVERFLTGIPRIGTGSSPLICDDLAFWASLSRCRMVSKDVGPTNS